MNLNHDVAIVERRLENCRRAMKPDASLVVIEAFFVEPGEQMPANMIDTQVPLFDLHLMLAVNGTERSVAEYSVLFDKVGANRPAWSSSMSCFAA
jgi:O-methyltransferase domain